MVIGDSLHGLATASLAYWLLQQLTGYILSVNVAHIRRLQAKSVLYRFHPKFTDQIRRLQATSVVYRLHPQFTGYICSLQATSVVYRLHLQFTGYIRSLQAASVVYRLHPQFTGNIRSLQTTSVFMLYPQVAGYIRGLQATSVYSLHLSFTACVTSSLATFIVHRLLLQSFSKTQFNTYIPTGYITSYWLDPSCQAKTQVTDTWLHSQFLVTSQFSGYSSSSLVQFRYYNIPSLLAIPLYFTLCVP